MPRLAALTIIVPDYDEAIDYFTSALGFALLEDTRLNESKRWVRVAPPGAETAILLAQPKNEKECAAIGHQTGGRVGFFLETDDFDRDHARMTAAGVTFEESPRTEPYGKVAVFRDAFGNLWDLIEPRR
ncbi:MULTISPECIES: VOC family protein [Henriciella]|jgi:catechol 2,3-dioxygenase-like lactoylglutathione lyase family enzyme|uniref:VOC domain-containing protein n=1 Tax=Henriciella pelagia TaxID=1977912 RepID=A0ABQ1JGN4_9PROT|nr:VOC family protein [Henriciella pelagia]GGB68475.1 hypothetical protein GCM10011503_16340 [Henriciella pelagia]